MKSYRLSILITFIIAIISLGVSIWTNFARSQLLSNIFLGIFGSGFILFVQSIIFYKVERNRYLRKFYRQACLLSKHFGTFICCHKKQMNFDQIAILGENIIKLAEKFEDLKDTNRYISLFKSENKVLTDFFALTNPIEKDLYALETAIENARLKTIVDAKKIENHFNNILQYLMKDDFANIIKIFEAIDNIGKLTTKDANEVGIAEKLKVSIAEIKIKNGEL